MSISEEYSRFHNSFTQNGEKLIVITNFGRSGSLFLQSLLDDHPDIVMVPQLFNFLNHVFQDLLEIPKQWNTLLLNYLKDNQANLGKFYSGLGENQDQDIMLNIEALMSILAEIFQDSTPSAKELFIASHFATYKLENREIGEVKFICAHEHEIPSYKITQIDKILKDFPSTRFLCMIRDPRGQYLSQIY